MGEKKYSVDLECDQCICEAIGHVEREFNIGQINPDPEYSICPKCKLRLCQACFDIDHIFCSGPGNFMALDLAVISLARAKGDQTHALEFYLPEFHAPIIAYREKQP